MTITAAPEASGLDAALRTMFETSGVGMAQVDCRTRRYAWVNRAFCTMTGYSETELSTQTIEELTHPDDAAADVERFRRVVSGEERAITCQKRYVRKDGATIWVQLTANLLRDANGTPWRAAAVVQDITDRVRHARNLAFIYELQTEFARLSTAEEITQTSGRRIAQYLNLSRCLFVEIDDTASLAYVFYDSCEDLGCSLVGHHTLADFHTASERAQLMRGEPVVIGDDRAGRDPEAVGRSKRWASVLC